MTLSLLDIDYEGTEKVRLRLVGRDPKGNLTLVTDEKFLPYFYTDTKKSDLEKITIQGKGAEKIETVKMLEGLKELTVNKVFLSHPKFVPLWRERVGKKWEADIPFVRRYMMDKGLLPLEGFKSKGGISKSKGAIINPKIMAFDIETFSESGLSRPNKDPVTMISLYGRGLSKVITWKGKSSKTVDVFENEKEMLEAFADEVERYDPDIIVGYNSDMFDFHYLDARCKKLKVTLGLGFERERVKFVKRGAGNAAKIFGRIHLDLYKFVRNILSPTLKSETLKLDDIAKELIGEGKNDIDWDEATILWKEGKVKKITDYCLQDGKVTYELAKKIVPMIIEISRITRIPPFDVARMRTGQIVEYYLIAKSGEKRLVPNRPERGELSNRRGDRVAGAFVVEPKKGLHENIAVADFRSLYPSIIVSHNISPETVDCKCCKKKKLETGNWFCGKTKGFIPEALEDVLNKRIKLKKELKTLEKGSPDYIMHDAKQKALKLIINSMYGYLGFPGGRWYSYEAASAVTSLGRKYIKETINLAKENGFVVLYGDTDSVFLKSVHEEKNFEKKVKDFIKRVNENLPDSMELELEDIFKRGVFVTKKRYALMDFDGKLVVKGLERVRRDWAPIAKDTQEAVLREVLTSGDVKKAVEIVRKKVLELKRGVDLKEVTIMSQLTRDVDNYKQIGPHVAAAKKMIARGQKVRAGTLIEYVVTKGSGSISERSEPVEFAKNYDANYYINNQVMPACLRVLEAFGYDEGKILKKQVKLDGWF